MKLIAKLKLLHSEEQRQHLLQTLETANDCCNWISERAWKEKIFGQYSLHHLCYKEARAKFSLGAEVVIRAIGKVSDSYITSKHRQIVFRMHGAFPYDAKMLRFYEASTVSIWSVGGRLKIPFVCGERQAKLLPQQQGQTDLLYHRQRFYLISVCNVDDPPLRDVDEFLGVDFGIKKIAATSDGECFSGSHTVSIRSRRTRLRRKLQSCGSKSAKRHLKRLSGKERAFATDTNHVISKQIVANAERTGRGIAIEDLNGIRDRIRAGRKQRALLHSWAFSQLRLFIAYKAALAGIPLVTVDPRNSSRECSRCHHVSKLNRPTQSKFACLSCGYSGNADINAAKVLSGRAATNQPIAARSL